LHKGGRNPTWAGPCLSRNPCSNPPHRGRCGGLRSQLRPVTDVDEGARQGQFGRRHMGSEWCAKLQAVPKHWAAHAARGKRVRVAFPETFRVVHGVTCSQWLTSLTGENPTPSRSRLRATRAYKSYEGASITRRRNQALLAGLLGDGSFSGVVPPQRQQRRNRRHPSRRRESMGAVSPQTASRLSVDRATSVRNAEARKHSSASQTPRWTFVRSKEFSWRIGR
jgi:hypothetical protein